MRRSRQRWRGPESNRRHHDFQLGTLTPPDDRNPWKSSGSGREVARDTCSHLRSFPGNSGVDRHFRPNTAARPDWVRRAAPPRASPGRKRTRRPAWHRLVGARSSAVMPAGSAWPACGSLRRARSPSCSLVCDAGQRRHSAGARERASCWSGRTALGLRRKRASTPRGSMRLRIAWGGRVRLGRRDARIESRKREGSECRLSCLPQRVLPQQRFYSQDVVGSRATRRVRSVPAASFEPVNRRQRRRRLARRRAHAAQKDEPRHTMSHASYTPVK